MRALKQALSPGHRRVRYSAIIDMQVQLGGNCKEVERRCSSGGGDAVAWRCLSLALRMEGGMEGGRKDGRKEGQVLPTTYRYSKYYV